MTVSTRPLLLLTVALMLTACGGSKNLLQRGEVLSSGTVASLTRETINRQSDATFKHLASGTIRRLGGDAKCDVTVHKLVYATIKPGGTPGATASAVLLVPVESATCPGPFPLLTYNHGTHVTRAESMADTTNSDTIMLTSFYASQQYVVVATDYLGLAESNLPYHPYMHAETEASASIDAVRAATKKLSELGTSLSGKLFVSGYSQGGHATMATHRVLEADPSLGLKVTASGAMSGSYDLDGTFVTVVETQMPKGSQFSSMLFPYAATAFQKIYGNIYVTPTDYFKEPYAADIESLLPGTVSLVDLFKKGMVPLQLGDIVTSKLITDMKAESSGIRQALKINTLLNWKPQAPMLLCGSSLDQTVPFRNALTSKQNIESLGGSVSLVDVEQEPEFTSLLSQLDATQRHMDIIPMCMKIVRDRQLAPLR